MKILSWIQHSFKRQIIFVLLCLMFFVTLLSISRLYYSGKNELAHILESQAFQLVDGLAISISNDVRYSNYFELSDTITHIYDNNHKLYLTEGDLFQVIDISVVDLENRTMAHSNPKEHPLQLKDPKIKEYEKLFKQNNSKTQFVWSEEDRKLHFRAPIYFGLEVIGVMYVNVSPTSLIKGESILLKELLTLVSILIFLLIIFIYFFSRWIDKPLHDIISELDKLGNGEIKFDSLSKRKDEFSTLAKAIAEADSRICIQKEELLEIQDNLHNKVKEEVDKNNEREKYLIQQSRLAQMGEMISMIAHQWRQPLGAISSTSINLQMKLELKAFDLDSKEGVNKAEAYFKERLKNIDEYVHNLTTTIDDFRNFYKPNKKAVTIKIEEAILKSLNIIKKSLEFDNIEIIEEYNSNEELELHDNEMMQVILNILKNAQDNFMEKGTENPYIRITTNDKTISICDNGGGIPEDIIENIFDPYFSTKDDKNGTGLGLYMSKTIIEDHHGGKLSAQNTEDGVCFVIEI